MNWWHKTAAGFQRVDDIPQHVFAAIRSLNTGNWSTQSAKRLIPSFRHQHYTSTEINGQDVKREGDKFYVKVFSEIRKKTEDIEYPPGYFADDNPPGGKYWGSSNSPERIKRERDHGAPFNHVSYYDPANGNELLSFRGMIEGWRPGLMPPQEIDPQGSATMKGYPIPVTTNPQDFRYNTERIDGFEGLRTPYEVAQFVQSAIDRFYNGGEEDAPEEPPQTPSPESMPSPVLTY